MISQRWASFSVRDHLPQQAFVLEVLLYDRLVIPVPPENDAAEQNRWKYEKRWNPGRLESLLDVLGKDLAIRIPWTEEFRQYFKTRLAQAQQINEEVSYGMTPLILAALDPDSRKDLFPDRPVDEPKPHILPVYPSLTKAKHDVQVRPIEDNQELSDEGDLALTVCHCFLKPKGVFSPRGVKLEKELLQQAAELAREEEFKENRRQFLAWEEKFINKPRATADSIEEMKHLLRAHEKIVRRAWKDAMWKRVFTVFKVGAGVAGASLALWAGHQPEAAAAGVATLAEIGRFIKFDAQPSIVPNTTTAPAVMLHTIHRRLDLDPMR